MVDVENFTELYPHTRYNPLEDEWILVSPHRSCRPWIGQIESAEDEEIPAFDSNNGLCPGATRSSGITNPKYSGTYIFDNDFPALLNSGPILDTDDDPLFKVGPAFGKCMVMCYHSSTNKTLATLTCEEILVVINKWQDIFLDLSEQYQWIQIFENKGTMMGCSNRHPHCQIWASDFIPNVGNIKDRTQLKYYRENGSPLLVDYVQKELLRKVRIIIESEHWVWLTPFWAKWPYETLLIPKRHILRLQDLNSAEKSDLAVVMKNLLVRYDNLFHISFPYSMGWHGAPTGKLLSEDNSHWQLHAIYYPPLLRSATVKKFMVGYEMLAQPQRDLTPEKAAAYLRHQSSVHYKEA